MAMNQDGVGDQFQRSGSAVLSLSGPSGGAREESKAPGKPSTPLRSVLLQTLVGLAALTAAAVVTIFCFPPGMASGDPEEPQATQPTTARPSPVPVANVVPKLVEIAPKPVKVGEIRRFEGTTGGVGAVAFSPDGSRMISGGADKVIRLRDVATGEDLRRFEGHAGAVTGLDFARDGRRILSGSDDGTVRLWDAESGELLSKLEGHTAGVSHVRFSPDGRRAASGSWDHTARVWDLGSGRPVHSLEHGDYVVGVSFSPDGRRLATGSWDRTVRLWDVDTGEEVRRFEGHADKAGDVAFAPDGRHVLSSSTDRTVRLWDAETGREVSRCEVGADAGWAVAISPDGRRALSVRGAGLILWDLAMAWPLHTFEGHDAQVTALAFGPDGRTALSGSRDGTARLWGLPSESEPPSFRPVAVARELGRPTIEAAGKALAQAPGENREPAAAKVGAAGPSPGPPGPADDAKDAGPTTGEFEAVKLADGSEVQVEKWGKTYSAYEYQPPLDMLDPRVHVVLDGQRDGVPQLPVTALEVDSKGGRLYWCEGLNRPSAIGRVMRSRLNGDDVEILATNRVYPRNLVLDERRGRIYWLQGVGVAPSTLQSASLDGTHETTLSKGLNQPFGLALDSSRGQLYYVEEPRLVRVNLDGTGEEVITANRRVVRSGFLSLAFDSVHDRLIGSNPHGHRWFGRDGMHVEYVPRMQYWAAIYGFAFDESHQKIYFADRQVLRRANLDCTQVEALVALPARNADDDSKIIAGDVALDLVHGQVYWTGRRMRGGAVYPTISRTGLRPLPEPIERPAPPRIARIVPAEQVAGGEIVLSGSGLTEAVAVSFIDDSTGVHAAAEFLAAGEGRLAVKVPRLGGSCRRPVVVVQTPSGVTMTLGTDVIAPEHTGYPYKNVLTLAPEGDTFRDTWEAGGGNRPYQHERSTAGSGARLWLRPGVIGGKIESAVVYATPGSSLTFGPKGMVTVFAKNDSYVADHVFSEVEVILYHEPFVALSGRIYGNATIKRIPVSAIRPSFLEQTFRYRVD